VEKKVPYDAVLDEMSLHSDLTRDELDKALMGLIDFLQERAHSTLDTKGGNSPIALEHAHQFLAFTELINFYGSALIAFDDIDEETLPN
jgi:hypothetical protein